MSNKWRHFLQLQAVLAVCCFLCLSLLVGRIIIEGEITYLFMAWNLFLGWLPLLFSILILYSTPKHKMILITLFLSWLLFFPNAIYMISDLLHLAHISSFRIPSWYDAVMLFSFALTGLFIAVVSLNYVHNYLRTVYSKKFSWLIVSLSILLSGFGVYLGRFLRWNSWDIIHEPIGLMKDVIDKVVHPVTNAQTYIVTLIFTIILFASYLLFQTQREKGL